MMGLFRDGWLFSPVGTRGCRGGRVVKACVTCVADENQAMLAEADNSMDQNSPFVGT